MSRDEVEEGTTSTLLDLRATTRHYHLGTSSTLVHVLPVRQQGEVMEGTSSGPLEVDVDPSELKFAPSPYN